MHPSDPVKAFLYRIARLATWHSGFGKKTARDKVVIFMVHGVHNPTMAARWKPPYNSLPLEVFAEGVRLLLRHYNVIPMDDAVAMIAGRKAWQPRCVVLTFDDSLKCLLPTAAAWLSGNGLSATFYISTEVIEQRQAYWWKRLEFAVDHATRPQSELRFPHGQTLVIHAADGPHMLSEVKAVLKKLPGRDVELAVQEVENQLGAVLRLHDQVDPYSDIMSWDDVKHLKAMGMLVGSHSVTHPNLSLLPREILREELETSRRIIAQKIGDECRHFCYPYGAHSDVVCEAARAAGYDSAVTTITPGFNRPGDDLLRLRRFAMPGAVHKIGWMLSGLAKHD